MNASRFLLSLVLCSFVFTSATSTAAQSQASMRVEPAELEAFVDGFMAAALDAYHTAGATVSVVQDGAVILSKGYGLADVEADKDVDATTSQFRIGSVSKLFVWTAVMQLVEQDKLDLRVDINNYLEDFKIPDKYGKPITMMHLMTHSPGFEDNPIGLFRREADSVDQPLGEVVAGQIPARVRPPGVVASYSNYGTALAAHIVENVSGQSFEDYVQEHIFNPLEMEYTTFRQPAEEDMPETMSKSYRWSGNKFNEGEFEYIPLSPAGSAASTAEDMAHFMIAHLQGGEYQGQRVLESDTVEQMHSTLFEHLAGINAMAHGFYEVRASDPRVIGHGGDTLMFHTQLALFPAYDLGFFVSANSEEGGQLRGAFTEEFIERYFERDDAADLEPPSDFARRAGRYLGWYRVNRYSHSTLAKLGAVQGAIKIELNEDKNALVMSADPNKEWVEVKPLLFREKDGYEQIGFREDDRGNINYAFFGNAPVVALERIGWFEAPPVQTTIFIVCLAVYLIATVTWPVVGVLRWTFRSMPRVSALLPLWMRGAGWVAATCFLVFGAGLTLVMLGNPTEIVYGVTPALEALLFLPLLGVLATIAVWIAIVVAWRGRRGWIGGRVFLTVLGVCCLVTIWQLYYWNLLGFNY